MAEEYVERVSQYIRIVEGIKEQAEKENNSAPLLFRGQPCDKPLLPKLGRIEFKTGQDLFAIEKSMLLDFKRSNRPFLKFELDAGSDPDYLSLDTVALAQHHGLPTRLLDWTYSALAALWFAVKDSSTKSDLSGDIRGEVGILMPTAKDYINDDITRNPVFHNNRIAILRPNIVSNRISAQAGVFTCHLVHEDKGKHYFESLEQSKYYTKLKKLFISPGDFVQIRKDLNILGVNYATQFPDLDGLCKHLEWKYLKYPYE